MLHEVTGVPEANIRRMMTYQEPKATFIAAAERIMGVQLGTVYRIAGLVEVDNGDIASLLASDPALHPVFRLSAPEMYAHWVKLSGELTATK